MLPSDSSFPSQLQHASDDDGPSTMDTPVESHLDDLAAQTKIDDYGDMLYSKPSPLCTRARSGLTLAHLGRTVSSRFQEWRTSRQKSVC
jgi:hypothetical protein